MRRALTFISVGTAVALVVEAAFNLLAAHTPGNFLFTVLFYPLYLGLFYCLSQFGIRKVVHSPRGFFFVLYLLGGIFGLMIEWFIIGNSPWGNHQAIQWGMWVYWTALVAVPMIYLSQRPFGQKLLAYTVFLYGGGALALAAIFPAAMQVAVQPLWQTAFFTGLHIPYFFYFKSQRQ